MQRNILVKNSNKYLNMECLDNKVAINTDEAGEGADSMLNSFLKKD